MYNVIRIYFNDWRIPFFWNCVKKMGSIIGSRTIKKGKTMLVEVELDYDEFTSLGGHFKKVHLFSEDVMNMRSTLSSKGIHSSTKYFLIPRTLRDGISLDDAGDIICHRLNLKNRAMFIYLVNLALKNPR